MSDDRVLVFMPNEKAAKRLRRLLMSADFSCSTCAHVDQLCREIVVGAGAAILSEEVIEDPRLLEVLRNQPPWSDFPLIVLTQKSLDSRSLSDSMNATFVERPVRTRSLMSMVRAALRSRLHQYAVRDHVETIHRERERYRVTLSSIGDAVIATDSSAHITFMNGVAEKLTGWSLPEAIGRPLLDVFRIVNEHTRAPVENPAERALREGTIVGLANHTVLIAHGGQEYPIDDSAAPIREGNQQTGAVLVFRDVTERKRAEEDRARLAAIVESSDDAIVGKTLDGTIRSWNEGAERVFGHTAAEAVGQHITLIIPPDRYDEEKSILARLRAGQRIDHFETVRVTKDGRQIDVSLTVSPIRNAAGQVVGASKVARDVTWRKQADAERARLMETLGLAIASADLGTWEWNPRTDLLTVSDRAAQIYGVASGYQGRGWMRDLIHPDHEHRVVAEANRSTTERTDYDVEYLLKNGTWVSVRGRGVYDTQQQLIRMHGVVADVTARKQSELALRESEGLYRVLVELTTVTQPLTEPAEIVAAVAQLLAEHLGADRCAYAEVEDESVYVITGDAVRDGPSIKGRWDIAAFGAEHLRSMRSNQPFVVHDVQTDSRITSDNLPAFHAADIRSVICVPLLKGGRLTAAMAVHQKIPRRWTDAEVRLVDAVVGRCWEALERARVARELDDIRARMEAGIDAGAIGTWAWDVQQDRFYGDASLARIFGVPLQAINGGPLSDLMGSIHPDDRPRVGELVSQVISAGGRYEADYRVIGDGNWRWITARGRVELDKSGQATRFPGVVIDITERKQAEEALARVTEEAERKKRLYETALSNTPDLVYVFGLDHRFHFANEALLKMWGRTWDEAIGKTCLELGYEPWHASMHDEEIERVVSTRKPIRGEVPFTGTNGRRVYDYIFSPVFGANGEVEAVAGTTRDITERQAMEQELRDADQKKDEFIALLAHELRNPLAPIRNGLQVLRLAGDDPQAVTEARSMMDRQLGHMVRLIDDLMDVSRISRNKMELRRARVSLKEIIASAVETVRPLIDEASHQLSLTLPDADVYLDADLTRLAQVFSNLLTNSAKYTPPGGKIWLTGELKNDRVQIVVRDTGIGIPAEFQDSLFHMFSQAGRSIERSTGGLGIGLALVKGLVEMHGGTVTAESAGTDQGSTFTVVLPTFEGQLALIEPQPFTERGPTRRVLVVDDNHDGADSLSLTLRLLGHDVRTAYNGADAVAVAEQFHPQLILMDVGMPRMNGLDATRHIRAQAWSRNTIIIALTGWGQENDRERSREAGCDGHLVKPVNLPDLQSMLATLDATH